VSVAESGDGCVVESCVDGFYDEPDDVEPFGDCGDVVESGACSWTRRSHLP
jgi:hypothetical protein